MTYRTDIPLSGERPKTMALSPLCAFDTRRAVACSVPDRRRAAPGRGEDSARPLGNRLQYVSPEEYSPAREALRKMPQTSPLWNRDHLRTDQYRDSGKLRARIALHERFSTNKYGWQRWVFDHLNLPENARVLELGCGAGALWDGNRSRIPAGWEIVLSDFSHGMLLDAKRSLTGIAGSFSHAVADAEAIPFADASFDCVVANHMLYHVPSVEDAIAEIHRVLKPRGRLFAATNGRNHLREMWNLVAEFDAQAARIPEPDVHDHFGLETGLPLLSQRFPCVVLHRYDDALVITEAGPLVAYLTSALAGPRLLLDADDLDQFRAFVGDRIARDGCIRVTKHTGLFEACR